MKKASFYHSFKVIDSSLHTSSQTVSFSVCKNIGSCAWADKVGSSISSSFDTEHGRFVYDLGKQFDYLKKIDSQLPSNNAFDYNTQRSSILYEIDSCRVGG